MGSLSLVLPSWVSLASHHRFLTPVFQNTYKCALFGSDLSLSPDLQLLNSFGLSFQGKALFELFIFFRLIFIGCPPGSLAHGLARSVGEEGSLVNCVILLVRRIELLQNAEIAESSLLDG
jgi:hypothetical protein